VPGTGNGTGAGNIAGAGSGPAQALLLDGAMALKPIGSNNIIIIVGLRKDRKLSRDLIDFVR
jgi:hypothetical protein